METSRRTVLDKLVLICYTIHGTGPTDPEGKVIHRLSTKVIHSFSTGQFLEQF